MGSPMGLLTKRDFLGEGGEEYQELIKDFDANQLTPVGYDFRAGECINLTLGQKVRLTEGVKYQIRHGDFVIVVTRETLSLGNRNDIFGQVFSKVSFAIQGLSHVGTKIDPGFEGPLVLSFKNEGYDIIEITKDTAICNVALQIISPTDARYSRRSFEYPTLTERPNLPFPLTPENWEKLSRWYSKEAFDTYLQWSDELSKLREYILTQQTDVEDRLIAKLNEGTQQLIGKLTQETATVMSRVETLSTAWVNYQIQTDTQSKQFVETLNASWASHRIQTDTKSKEFMDNIKAQINRVEGDVKEETDRADRIYGGAVLTIFIATIAVIGVLISSAALFVNQLNVRVQGEVLPVSKNFLYICAVLAFLFLCIVVGALWSLLRKK